MDRGAIPRGPRSTVRLIKAMASLAPAPLPTRLAFSRPPWPLLACRRMGCCQVRLGHVATKPTHFDSFGLDSERTSAAVSAERLLGIRIKEGPFFIAAISPHTKRYMRLRAALLPAHLVCLPLASGAFYIFAISRTSSFRSSASHRSLLSY
jgi:hypothetical protein